ncbi:MAG: PLP-dependent aminotransferase family protein [Lachnospiraceae bacterium]|nr:PLP-dependent aminotransferase family protein [Lachnospiraceae bacterium]
MLTYSISDRGSKSLYEYLYTCIRQDIITGVLPPHTKLPSKRAFATNHGISVVTVENTYGQLQAEGYIYSRPKSGFFVSPIDLRIPTEQPKAYSVSVSDPAPVSASFNLISNHTAPDNFPFSIWAKIIRQLLTAQDKKLLISPPTGGVMELRSAIADHLYQFRGILCDPEQIIIGAGTEYLYSLIVQLLGRDKIYGLENPSSKKIRSIYQAAGVRVVPLSMDQEGIELTPENLTMPDIVQISPSHHFPTGIVTSVSRRYGLLQWANQAPNRYIIEDDYDSEFRLQGKPIPSLFSMDATDKVIYFNTFTKSLASTIRISYMVLPRPLLEVFRRTLGFYACTVSNFEQYTLAAFIQNQYFEKHINRMRNHYRGLRDVLIRELTRSPLKNRIRISGEDAGLHFLLKLDTDCSDDFLKEKAREKGIDIAFLSDYYSSDYKQMDSSYVHTAIVNYSALGEQDMDSVAKALVDAWLPWMQDQIPYS